MPPPPPTDRPCLIVIPLIVTLAPLATANTPTASLPLTMVFVRPLPVIVSVPLSTRTGNGLVSVIVPLALGAKVIGSSVAAALAAMIASRSEQSAASQLPSLVSAVFVTTNVCARAGVGVGVDAGVGV